MTPEAGRSYQEQGTLQMEGKKGRREEGKKETRQISGDIDR